MAMIHDEMLALASERVMGAVMIDKNVMDGTPVLGNTRIPVYVILDYLADGASIEEILSDFPQLTKKDIQTALSFASYVTRAKL